MKHIPRIYVKSPLSVSAVAVIKDDSLYHLTNVLRISNGDKVKLFNEQCGEWLATCVIKKNCIECECIHQTIQPYNERSLCLVFSIISNHKMHFILEKCTELGVTTFIPIITEYTQCKNFNMQKAETIVTNAVEQCGRLSIPNIMPAVKLRTLLEQWDAHETMLVCDLCDRSCSIDLICSASTFLIGPEGGFSNEERALFEKYDFITCIKISDNILRSETAAVSICAIHSCCTL